MKVFFLKIPYIRSKGVNNMDYELLIPVGSLEKLKIALLYGADAVYIGGKNYSLRANASNFTNEEIKKATDYVHSLNKKIYVTVNIVFHEEDLKGLKDYLIFLNEIKIDGVIFSDISVLKIIKENNLNLNMCLSTQMSVANKEHALFWKNLGVKRVVVARECNKDTIKSIIDTGISVEVFIHGAMCMAYSGQCVLSNYCTNRDSNRGGCAQVCRWLFDVNKPHKFSIMPKDLNMVRHIKELMDMKVESFKIEGRMRSIYYIATVTLIYKTIMQKVVNNTLDDEYINYAINILNRCANRESTSQFFDKLPGFHEQYYQDRDEVSNQDFLGLIKSYDEINKIITLEQRNYFKVGDIVQIFGPNTETFDLQITKIYNEDGNLLNEANHPQMIVKIPCDKKVEQFDMIRIKIFDKL